MNKNCQSQNTNAVFLMSLKSMVVSDDPLFLKLRLCESRAPTTQYFEMCCFLFSQVSPFLTCSAIWQQKYVNKGSFLGNSWECTLRSATKNTLQIPRTKLRNMGDRAFSSAAPRLWNTLPDHLRAPQTAEPFKRDLKTHLFKKANC